MPDPHTPPGSTRSYQIPELTDPNDPPQWFTDFANSLDPHLTDIAASAGDEPFFLMGA